MLEGLEVSEILISRIIIDNLVLRIDSEYFKKKFLIEDQNRSKFKNEYLGNIAFITDGQHGYHEVDDNSPIRHLTAKNAKGWFANDLSADRIAKWVDDNNKRSSLCKNDLILSTRGTVGLCAIVDNDVLPANIDQDVARIEIIKKDILPSVVLTYLNSQIGQDWLERNQTGMVQQGIALWRVREIPLPVFSIPFQDKIDSIIKISKSQKVQAKTIYSQAETLLLQSIGLLDFKPSSEAVNIKNFKDLLGASGRLDAEFYDKKYEEFENKIKCNAKGFTSIAEEYTLVNKLSKKDLGYYKYIEIGDINVSDGTSTFNTIETKYLPANAKTEVKIGDILISKVRPNRGAVTIIETDADNMIVSGAFTVLRGKADSKYIVETLKVILRLDMYKQWLLKFNVGTQYPVIKDDDILNLPIPLIEKSIQDEINDFLTQSQVLKKESEHLLEVAKKAVEIAIEEGEERAMDWIVANTGRGLDVSH